MKEKLTQEDFNKLRYVGILITLIIFFACYLTLYIDGNPSIKSLIIAVTIGAIFIAGYFWICLYEERFQLAMEIKANEDRVFGGLYNLVAHMTDGRGMIEKEKRGLRYLVRIIYLDSSIDEQKYLLSRITNYLKVYDELHVCFRIEVTGLSTNSNNN